MKNRITITGIVGSELSEATQAAGGIITKFRLVSNQGYYDKSNVWIETGANWYNVSAFRKLAPNVRDSLRKGEHIIVGGSLYLKEWVSGDKKGISLDLDAEFVGHDLNWCTTRSQRNGAAAPAPSATEEPSVGPTDDTCGPEGWPNTPSDAPSDDGFLPTESALHAP
ncbi:single-stranded DNA-binding protein [Glaciibacter psychrotolerans]|uniref:Single-strand DNA-binding protein n=1 Tax=Glaciibacter psychrotolerans TaxID=670054 RepID=A0A7Z0J5J7_9MICO|nr:single-stranded DNA-binding protein [Leifsonia psychrotolerans]NYJ19221.1 single-strand DNA-binding protein [Leifsonia psychrotolerans]